jgi:MFS family permease
VSYFREFASYWPNLLGAAVGLALGSALHHYMLNLFGPALLADFGWSKAQFALVGSLGLVSMLAVPFLGKFVDRFGPRPAAIIGFSAVPLGYFAFSLMTGPIWQFYAIYVFKNILGILTTTLVFCRVVVEKFDSARGIALSMLMSAAPLAGAIFAPIIGEVVDNDGWRAGYRIMALVSALGGVFAISLMGRSKHVDSRKAAKATDLPAEDAPRHAGIRDLVREPVFLLLVGGMLLVNFPQIIVMSQIKLVALDKGATAAFATWLVSVYAITVIVGRFTSGIALDRIPAHLVALATLGLPAVGYALLASPASGHLLIGVSIGLVGLAQGAEGDLGAFLTSRKFDMRNYSFVYSFVIASIGIAAAVGSILLSYTLHMTDSFSLFLIMSAVMTLAGAFCFYLTGRYPGPRQSEDQ